MDNLEFLQWMKRYHDINYNGEPYDAVGRRKGQDLFYILGGGKVGGAGGAKTAGVKPKTTAAPSKIGVGAKPKTTPTTTAATGVKKAGGADSGASADVKQLQSELSEAKLNMDTLEKERDFYFGKLRDIEMLLQANPTL